MFSQEATFRSLILLAALTLVPAACGGGSATDNAEAPEGADSTEAAPETTEAPEETESGEAAPEDTEELAESGSTDGATEPSFPVSEDLELLLQDMSSWAEFAGETSAGSEAMEAYYTTTAVGIGDVFPYFTGIGLGDDFAAFEGLDPSAPEMENLGGGAIVEMEAMDALQGGEDIEVGSLLYLGVYPAGTDQAMFNDEVVADLPDGQPVIGFRIWTGE